jgi:hypothetical protein
MVTSIIIIHPKTIQKIYITKIYISHTLRDKMEK